MLQRIHHDNSQEQPKVCDLRCSVCPGRSVCLEWHRNLSLRLDYEDVLGALDCLDELLDQPAWRFALGRQYFCAFHDGDDSFYLVCREYVVLRLSGAEARLLRAELTQARESLDQELGTLADGRNLQI
jgi:hypothetical protein